MDQADTKHIYERWKEAKAMALVAAVILAAAGIGLGLYRDHNLHHDERMTRRALSAGVRREARHRGGRDGKLRRGAERRLGPPPHTRTGDGVGNYSPVLPALAKRYHVFAVDCLGHGESARDPSLYPTQIGRASCRERV